MQRVALLVKYFPGSERISGLTSFATVLAERMAKHCDLYVFSQCTKQQAEEISGAGVYKLYSVPRPFWFTVGKYVKRSKIDTVIVLSGVHKSAFLYFMCLEIKE